MTRAGDPGRGDLAPHPIWRALAAFTLVAYVSLLLWLTLAVMQTDQPEPNLVPFWTIAKFCYKGGSEFLVNVVGNVVGFVPVGALVPMSRRRPTSAVGMLLFGSALSASIEVMQLASGKRVADVDDVILNTAGTLAGYALYLRARRAAVSGRTVETGNAGCAVETTDR